MSHGAQTARLEPGQQGAQGDGAPACLNHGAKVRRKKARLLVGATRAVIWLTWCFIGRWASTRASRWLAHQGFLAARRNDWPSRTGEQQNSVLNRRTEPERVPRRHEDKLAWAGGWHAEAGGVLGHSDDVHLGGSGDRLGHGEGGDLPGRQPGVGIDGFNYSGQDRCRRQAGLEWDGKVFSGDGGLNLVVGRVVEGEHTRSGWPSVPPEPVISSAMSPNVLDN